MKKKETKAKKKHAGKAIVFKKKLNFQPVQ